MLADRLESLDFVEYLKYAHVVTTGYPWMWSMCRPQGGIIGSRNPRQEKDQKTRLYTLQQILPELAITYSNARQSQVPSFCDNGYKVETIDFKIQCV